MKRISIYVVIILLLGLAIWWVMNRQSTSSMDTAETEFAIQNIEQVYKIFMVDKNGNKVELTRKENIWYVNGKYPVIPGSIGELLKAVQRVKISRPVPKSKHNTIVKMLSTNSTKVEIYNQQDQLLKTYFVGAPTEDHFGTYMILANKDGKLSQKPYITHIPGFTGFLTVRYFTDENKWRSRKIINLRADQIQSIEMKYSDFGSFELIVLEKDSFQLQPLDGEARAEAPHKVRIASYLEGFFDIHAETFQNEDPHKDSILNSIPFCELTIKSLVTDDNRITIYFMPVSKRTKGRIDQFGNPIPFDRDRYFAVVNQGKDFAVIQHFVFGKILRRYPDFFSNNSGS